MGDFNFSFDFSPGALRSEESSTASGGVAIREVAMDFLFGAAFGTSAPEAYERLLLGAMRGDATLFTRDDEVEQAWSILQPILSAWSSGAGGPLHFYAAGTWGPPAADELLERDGRAWRRP